MHSFVQASVVCAFEGLYYASLYLSCQPGQASGRPTSGQRRHGQPADPQFLVMAP